MIFRAGWVFTSDNSAPASPTQFPQSSRYRTAYHVMDVNYPGFGLILALLTRLFT